MKTISFLSLLLSALLARAFTYQSASELFLSADLDGDTRADLVIVDRVSGRLVGLMTRKDLMRTRGNAISAETDRLSYFLRRKKLSATTG